MELVDVDIPWKTCTSFLPPFKHTLAKEYKNLQQRRHFIFLEIELNEEKKVNTLSMQTIFPMDIFFDKYASDCLKHLN